MKEIKIKRGYFLKAIAWLRGWTRTEMYPQDTCSLIHNIILTLVFLPLILVFQVVNSVTTQDDAKEVGLWGRVFMGVMIIATYFFFSLVGLAAWYEGQLGFEDLKDYWHLVTPLQFYIISPLVMIGGGSLFALLLISIIRFVILPSAVEISSSIKEYKQSHEDDGLYGAAKAMKEKTCRKIRWR